MLCRGHNLHTGNNCPEDRCSSLGKEVVNVQNEPHSVHFYDHLGVHNVAVQS